MNLKYIIGAMITIFLAPILYIQGKRIKKNIPDLPEASEPEGIVNKAGTPSLKVLAIGESTIAGVGVKTHEEGFAGALGQALASHLDTSIHWKVYAKSGYAAKRVHEEILPQITEKHVDLLVLGLGGNDAFELNSPGHWKKEVQKIIDRLRNQFPETPIVFGNMPPIKEFPAFTPLLRFVIGNLGEILGEELAKLVEGQENVYFYSRKIALKDWAKRLNVTADPSEYFSDGVHPSQLTYQTWAKDLVSYMSEQGILSKEFITTI